MTEQEKVQECYLHLRPHLEKLTYEINKVHAAHRPSMFMICVTALIDGIITQEKGEKHA